MEAFRQVYVTNSAVQDVMAFCRPLSAAMKSKGCRDKAAGSEETYILINPNLFSSHAQTV